MLTRLVIPLVCALSLVACDDNSSNDPVDQAEDNGNIRGEELADQISLEFAVDESPTLIAQTGSILRALNDGEINQAAFALDIVATADVADFANQLVAQHMLANAQLTDVMRTYGVSFQPTQAEAMLAADANEGVALLRTTPPDQIDFTFLELQVQMHSSALVMLDELDDINDTEPMQDFIDTTRDMVDHHLHEAMDIHDSLAQ
jgi:predicted outer membrane protein